MDTETDKLANPYVGPCAFQSTQTLYGRERELRELLDSLIADRIVLLHSPSGAGKTSLIQASLVPALRKQKFRVLNIARVAHPTTTQDLGLLNRYVTSTILWLEDGLPEEKQTPEKELSGMTLNAYLDKLFEEGDKAEAVVLIFDQFEEILTLDPIDEDQKREFFKQVGKALENRRLWALFSMREDYLAALEPYRNLIPTQLENTVRLDLLGIAEARLAIQEPASKKGVAFRKDAADLLINDLRKVKVQRWGKTVEDYGPYVEPVQLQVVCHRLWTKLAKRWQQDANAVREIIIKDIEGGADVHQALAGYYADKIEEITEELRNNVQERDLRDWFENNLISEQGLRGQVLQGENQSQGLDNTIIQKLINAYLVREEIRRGITWFELAHDRLIEPIRESNSSWRDVSLTPFQIQAIAWKRANEDQNLLLSGTALAEAERWAGQYIAGQGKLTVTERRFLEACGDARERLAQGEREFRLRRKERVFKARFKKKELRARRNKLITFGAVLISIIAIFGCLVATISFFYARQQSRISLGRQISSDAVMKLNSDPQQSMLLALLALAETYSGDDNQPIATDARDARDALSLALNASQVRYIMSGAIRSDNSNQNPGEVRSVAFSPDGNNLATANGDGSVRIWDAITGKSLQPFGSEACAAVSYSPDGTLLASVSEDGSVTVWSSKDSVIQNRYWIKPSDRVQAGSGDLNESGQRARHISHYAIAFSPRQSDGSFLLASLDPDGRVRIWKTGAAGAPVITLGDGKNKYYGVAFSPDGKSLAAGGEQSRSATALHKPSSKAVNEEENGICNLWSVSNWREEGTFPTRQPVLSVALGTLPSSEAGEELFIATGGENGEAGLRNTVTKKWTPLTGHNSGVLAIAFSRSNRLIATAGEDRTVRVWDAKTGSPFSTLSGHAGAVRSVAFGPDERHLASGSEDSTVRLWNLGSNQSRIEDLSMSNDGKKIAAISRDGIVNIREVDSAQNQVLFYIPAEAPPAERKGKENTYASPFRKIGFVSGPYNSGDIMIVNRDQATPWIANSEVYQAVPIYAVRHEGMTSLAYSKPSYDPVTGEQNDLVLATATENGTVIVWRAGPLGNEFRCVQAHGSRINAIAVSPDGLLLATASDDRTVKVWNVANLPIMGSRNDESKPPACEKAAELFTLRENLGSVLAVAFSPNGDYLTAGGADRIARVWDVKSGNLIQTLRGHTDQINAVALNWGAGKKLLLATAGSDGKIKLWDALNGNEEPPPSENSVGSIRAIALSEDGKLVTASEDGNIWVHLLSTAGTEDLLKQVRRRITSSWVDLSTWPKYLDKSDKVYQNTLAAMELVLQGNEEARAGRIDEAVKRYTDANDKDCPVLRIKDPRREAKELAEEGYQERGQNFAKAENWEAAVNEYRHMEKWDHLFEVGQKLVKYGYVNDNVDLVKDAIELYKAAGGAYQLAKQADPNLEERNKKLLSRYYNYLCWYGSWWGNSSPEVMKACNQAVDISGKDPSYVDSRGVARALAWECDGDQDAQSKAIQDFNFYVESTFDEEERQDRTHWIEILKRGNRRETIFTPEFISKELSRSLTQAQLERIRSGCRRTGG